MSDSSPLPFVQVGLRADSQVVRCLACKTSDFVYRLLSSIFISAFSLYRQSASLAVHAVLSHLIGRMALQFMNENSWKNVSCLLENFGENTVPAAQLIVEHDIYPLLLDCLINGNEQVATASMDAIKSLAGSFEGMEIIFPANDNEATHLRNLAARCSSLEGMIFQRPDTVAGRCKLGCLRAKGPDTVWGSPLGRVRVLALVVKLFSVSSSVASLIHNSDLLNLLEAEVCNTDDTLVTLSVLELLYEVGQPTNISYDSVISLPFSSNYHIFYIY
ncbi:hypothetical protein CK203_089292 [Vitis vinifera]|uniref:Uncharacterized protein n=1 Tax=Vitis vinifera TaxID=29760 RepID=A0A438BSY3_VITVI|nr:hypothetical protein CK203_089292 [Vitis vinifera]